MTVASSAQSYPRAFGGAFLMGGAVAVVGEVIILTLSFTPLYAAGLSTVASMLVLGLLFGVLFALGIYQKMEAFGGMGAMMSFGGLAAGIAGMFFGVTTVTGSRSRATTVTIRDFFLKILMLATAICTVLALVYYRGHLSGDAGIPYAPGGLIVGPTGPTGVDPIAFVWAFLVGGAICACAQVLLMVTRAPRPIFFTCMFILGAVLYPFGIMKDLVSLSGAGMQINVIAAGEAVCSTFEALMMGMPRPYITLIGLLVVLTLLGMVFGLVRLAVAPPDHTPPVGAESEAEVVSVST